MRKKPGKNEVRSSARESLLTLRKDLCRGCTHCLRVCPTEAIRIRHGKAEVMLHRCIQCGECIRVCPREAWRISSGSLDQIKKEGDARAVLDPAVFGQFGAHSPPQRVMKAFREAGFPGVEGMGESYEIYRDAVLSFLSCQEVPRPAISSDCPAVVQLVQVKFPSLLENLVPILPPYEVMASELKGKAGEGKLPNRYYIVPCLAKAYAAIAPLSPEGGYRGAIPVAEIYNPLKTSLHHEEGMEDRALQEEPEAYGIEWSFPGGESRALGRENSLTVDGIHHVAGILELAENGLLEEVPFIEAWSCAGGCLGGPLNVQNPYFARFHSLSWIRNHPSPRGKISGEDPEKGNRYRLTQPFAPRGGMRLDEDLRVAMEKLRRIDEIVKKFPGIDCGSCGCPNCLALAEDVVQGYASETNCLYVMKGKKTKT